MNIIPFSDISSEIVCAVIVGISMLVSTWVYSRNSKDVNLTVILNGEEQSYDESDDESSYDKQLPEPHTPSNVDSATGYVHTHPELYN